MPVRAVSANPVPKIMATTAASYEDDKRLRGIALMAAAFVFFAGLDSCAKYLSQGMDSTQIVWARFAGHFVLAAIVLLPARGVAVMRTQMPWTQLGRGVLILLATLFNFLALRWLQLAETAAIFFLIPLLVAALSVPLLGERVGARRWAAIIVGFLGVLVIVRPGLGVMHWAVVFSLMNAAAVALYQIQTRKVAGYESAETSILLTPILGIVVLAPLLPFVWVTPETVGQWAALLAMGVAGGVGHWLLIAAHKYAPASLLAPFNYTYIVWMTGAGFLFFGDLPDLFTVLGAGIVVASGLYVFHRERKVMGEVRQPPVAR